MELDLPVVKRNYKQDAPTALNRLSDFPGFSSVRSYLFVETINDKLSKAP